MTDPIPQERLSFGRIAGYSLLGFGVLSMLLHAGPGPTSDAAFLVFLLAVFHAVVAGLIGLLLLFLAPRRQAGLLSARRVLVDGTTYCLNTFTLGPMH